ncbi:hypothetical protein DIS24_g4723 [Lasiodiplodia hormozganensis]|uniref:Uncharacterized protein n=1 Tax=Lasiodiplodia hormozganensis TaxID=869390 RepID=A0AA39YVN8_9PEZI|nr:hypothetical protein DIS24_g4723 [Lasiodiplodia hormozganensis]
MPSPPYMYDPPQRYSATSDTLYGFDPKAVTKASRMPPRSPPKKQDGPLVDFNKHPDSYLVLANSRSNVKPMNPRVKVAIKWVRWVQLGFRVLQLIGAIGLLICVICIKGTQDTEGWIIRIPAAVDIVCELYAIYHLVRPAKSRAPSSSASYHFFSLIVDTGLIPFYVFTAMLANSNWQEAPGTEGRWRTFFSTDDATSKILLTTWLTSVTVGGLHLISLGIGLYLTLVFRKIGKLPPDMNPLEDNLTSRRSTRHKHKTSSLSGITIPPEKRFSELSGSTAVSSPTKSSYGAEDPLIPDVRTMPFMDSRRNSDILYNPHNPRSARESRLFESRHGSMSPPKLDLKNLPVKMSPGGYDSMSPTSSPERSPVRSARSMKRQSLKSDNWFVHAEGEGSSPSDDEDEPNSKQPLVRRYSFEADDDGAVTTTTIYKDIIAHNGPLSPLSDGENTGYLRPQPLRMNPPSPQPPINQTNKNGIDLTKNKPSMPPPMPSFQSEIGSISSDRSSNIGRALTINSSVTRTTDAWGYFPTHHHHHHGSSSNVSSNNGRNSVEPPAGTHSNFSSPSRSPTRKARYYGDLRDAQEGILGGGGGNRASNDPRSGLFAQHLGLPSRGDGTTRRSIGRSPERPAYARVESSPRVVSRSGVDVELVDGDLGDVRRSAAPGSGGRQRIVSGKAAEEGLAGPDWEGVTRRKVSGMV